MRYFRTRMRSTRFLLVSAAVGIVVLAGAAVATASLVGYPTDSVTVMTGCLTTNGTGAGNIVNVAASPSNPSKACGSNQKLVHLSGGTITRVTAGTGLTTTGSGGTGGSGYVDNGFATLGLLPGFSLPQNCGSNQVAKSSGSNTWACANDANTTYSNGTGLDLSNTNEFSLNSNYQLPQNCTSGQFPDWGGQTWACGNDQDTTYSGTDFATSGQDCQAGEFVTGIDGNGALKCAQPTVAELQGSPCTVNGQSSTLAVSTDNSSGVVTMTCTPVTAASECAAQGGTFGTGPDLSTSGIFGRTIIYTCNGRTNPPASNDPLVFTFCTLSAAYKAAYNGLGAFTGNNPISLANVTCAGFPN